MGLNARHLSCHFSFQNQYRQCSHPAPVDDQLSSHMRLIIVPRVDFNDTCCVHLKSSKFMCTLYRVIEDWCILHRGPYE